MSLLEVHLCEEARYLASLMEALDSGLVSPESAEFLLPFEKTEEDSKEIENE